MGRHLPKMITSERYTAWSNSSRIAVQATVAFAGTYSWMNVLRARSSLSRSSMLIHLRPRVRHWTLQEKSER